MAAAAAAPELSQLEAHAKMVSGNFGRFKLRYYFVREDSRARAFAFFYCVHARIVSGTPWHGSEAEAVAGTLVLLLLFFCLSVSVFCSVPRWRRHLRPQRDNRGREFGYLAPPPAYERF